MLCKELYESKYYEARIIAFLSIDPNDLSDEEFLSWTMCDQSSSLTENYVVEMAIKHDNAHQYTMDFMNSNNPVLESLAYNLYAKAIKKGLFEQNIVELNKIIAHIENRLQISSNRVKYTMNNFLIAVACYVKKLRKNVYETHRVIGKFTVDMGKTACKIPDVIKFTKKYIAKHEKNSVSFMLLKLYN